jgi:hypothetical protein
LIVTVRELELPASSFATTCTALLPLVSESWAAHWVTPPTVVTFAVPAVPVVRFAQVTLETPMLSETGPLRVIDADAEENVDAELGSVSARVGGTASGGS